MNESDKTEGGRTREHPTVRFAPAEHEFDLQAVVGEMANAPSRRGQRQKALYHHGGLTVALFTFEAGAGLPDHLAAGVVTIHTLMGKLCIKCGTVEHELVAGKLLVLAPNVRHDVVAEVESTMLLQVFLDPTASSK